MATKKGTFTINTSTGAQNITGLNFRPKFVLIWGSNQTAFGESLGPIQWSMGMACAEAQFVQGGAQPNNSQLQGGTFRDDAVLNLTDRDNNAVARAAFTAFSNDGFSINVTTAPGSAYIFHYFAIGGTLISKTTGGSFNGDNSVNPAQQTVTLPDSTLTPSVVVGMGRRNAGGGFPYHSYALAAGAISFCVAGGSAYNFAWKKENSIIDVAQDIVRQKAFGAFDRDVSGSVDQEADWIGAGLGSFTVRWDEANTAEWAYIAIEGGTWDVDWIWSPASTGVQLYTAGAGWQPEGALAFGYTSSPQDTDATIAGTDGTDQGYVSILQNFALSAAPNYDAIRTNTTRLAVSYQGVDSDAPYEDGYAIFDSFAATGINIDYPALPTPTDNLRYLLVQMATGEAGLDYVVHPGTANGETPNVLEQGPGGGGGALVDTKRGRSMVSPLNPPTAGSASFLLDNTDGTYDAASFLPHSTVIIRRTESGTDADLWYGYTDWPRYRIRGHRNAPLQPVTDVTLQGVLADFAGRRFSSELYSDITTDVALGALLDAAGFPAAKRSFDTGLSVLRYWWLDDVDGMTAIRQILASEGVPARIYEGPDGSIVFKNRNHRFFDAASTSIQSTIRNSGTAPLLSGFSYRPAWENVVNRAIVDYTTREADSATSVVWSAEQLYVIEEGGTLVIEAVGSDPFLDAITPVENTDFTVGQGVVDSVSINRTSGSRVTITFQASATDGSVVLDGVQLRATSVPVKTGYEGGGRAVNSVDATASIAQYGERTYQAAAWPDIYWHSARLIADAAVNWYKDGRAVIVVDMAADRGTDEFTAAMRREIGDRVRVIHSTEGIDEEGWIEHITHSIDAPLTHTTRFEIEVATATPYTFTDPADVAIDTTGTDDQGLMMRGVADSGLL